MASDTVVYTITGGYLPTLAFRQGDFQPKARISNQDTLQNYGDILDENGNIKNIRVRGNAAWFEYSTAIKPVEGMLAAMGPEIEGEQYGKKQLKNMAREWYRSRDKIAPAEAFLDRMAKRLFKDMEEGEDYGEISQWSGDEMSELERQVEGEHIPENVEAIDSYVRLEDGNIYRFDIAAETIDETLGISPDVAGIGILGMEGIKEDAAGFLAGHFKKTQEGWNRQIRTMKDLVIRGNDKNARQYLESLMSGGKSLDQINENSRANLEKGLKELDKIYKGDPKWMTSFDRFKHQQNINMLSTHSKSQGIKHLLKHMTGQSVRGQLSQAAKSGTENTSTKFIMKALGNVVNLFAANSTTKGGYSVGYNMKNLGGKGRFTVHVMHKIAPTGIEVFEFLDINRRDIVIQKMGAIDEAIANMINQQNSNITTEQAANRSSLISHLKNVTDGKSTIQLGTATKMTADKVAADIAPGGFMVAPSRAKINELIDKWVVETQKNPNLGATLMTGHLKDQKMNLTHGRHQRDGFKFVSGDDKIVPTDWQEKVSVSEMAEHRWKNIYGRDPRYQFTQRETEASKIKSGSFGAQPKNIVWNKQSMIEEERRSRELARIRVGAPKVEDHTKRPTTPFGELPPIMKYLGSDGMAGFSYKKEFPKVMTRQKNVGNVPSREYWRRGKYSYDKGYGFHSKSQDEAAWLRGQGDVSPSREMMLKDYQIPHPTYTQGGWGGRGAPSGQKFVTPSFWATPYIGLLFS